jgi:hypothetical protein
MGQTLSFRNAVEALIQPEIHAGVDFAHTVKSDSEAAASGNVTSAFLAATSAFSTTPGTLEVRVFAAIGAFATTLLGYEVGIIRKDAAAAVANDTDPKAA